jgi:pimeloyl-ACP methyl ester carboxylesterase
VHGCRVTIPIRHRPRARNQGQRIAESHATSDILAGRCPPRMAAGRTRDGDRDDLEPYANLQRLAGRLPDIEIVRFEGMSHFGPWAWPGVITAVIAADT